jgi:hypothetical protein
MEISVSTQKEYIPEWNDNRQDEKPLRVIHKKPTLKLRSQLLPQPKITMRISAKGDPEGGDTVVEVNNERLVRGMVDHFEDFAINVDGKRFEIQTVDDLFSDNTPSRVGDLVDELGTYFQRLLSRKTDTKN